MQNSIKEQIIANAQEKLNAVAQKEATVGGLEEKKGALSVEITKFTETKGQLTGEIAGLEAEKSKQQTALNEIKEAIASSEAKAVQIDDQIGQKNEQAKQLNSEIAAKEGKLRELKNDINLFPVEISGFAAEGGAAAYRYILMGIIPSAILAFLAIELYHNAERFQYVSNTDTTSVWELLLSRLPYVVVTVAVVEVCFRILRMFVIEVMAIYRQRLNLSKLSVIAKDVSDAASYGTSLSDDEIFERRTRLKMTVLKEHLKEYLPGGFEYAEVKKVKEKAEAGKEK